MNSYAGRHASVGPETSGAAPEDVTAELLDVARAWLADDPDPTTRAELAAVIERAEAGDAETCADLVDRFSGILEFGTAGLRGRLGAGPHRMNRAVVIRAAAGLTAYLRRTVAETRRDAGTGDGPVTVVVGYDARHNSDVFAEDTAAVVVGAGGRALVLPRPLPTPVLAFAIRHLDADAGVMVTASHNPPEDNGYKVYLGDGAQIVPPADRDIAAEIVRVEAVSEVPRADEGWEVLGEEILDAYLDAVAAVVEPDTQREVRVVHTALHGVGAGTLAAAFERAGFPAPQQVASQSEPDPEFPTVAFPNPEEEGAIDAALDLARETTPDVVIANDPDADRCAVAVPDEDVEGGWRMLTGDEVGSLLGSHLIVRGVAEDDVFANSIVSSRLLAAICEQNDVPHVETLTGFKWIARAENLRYGYEEALGYCVAPDVVRDKDGVSAALLVAELVAVLNAEGRDLLDVLDDLYRQHGVHTTDAYAVRVTDLEVIDRILDRLRAEPPTTLAGVRVTSADDLARGADGVPPTEGLRYHLEDRSRVILRPSGTEPKLKVYLEVIEEVADDDLAGAKERAGSRMSDLRSAVEELTTEA